MAVIYKDSLKIAMMMGEPHGHRTVNALSFPLIGIGNSEIYVMDADGGNQQNLTNHPRGDIGPAWLNTPFSVSPTGKKFAMWGWLKQLDR